MTPVSRTIGPRRVDEVVVNVLLRVLHNPLDVLCGKLPQPDCVIYNETIVRCSKRGVHVVKQQTDNSFLVSTRHGHLFCPSDAPFSHGNRGGEPAKTVGFSLRRARLQDKGQPIETATI